MMERVVRRAHPNGSNTGHIVTVDHQMVHLFSFAARNLDEIIFMQPLTRTEIRASDAPRFHSPMTYNPGTWSFGDDATVLRTLNPDRALRNPVP